MKKGIRIMSLVIMFVFLITSAAACGSKPKTSGTTPGGTGSSKQETSKFVTLKMYCLGDTGGKYAKEALDNVNKILKEKINANLDVAMISWGDWRTKLPVVLASGESFDMVYTAQWALYFQEGPKGAYKALDDLLPKYAPKTYAEIPKEAWEQTKIEGKIYMVPGTIRDYGTHGVMVRGDLRKKYNVPEIKSVKDLGVYMEAVKKNMPDLIPLNDKAPQTLHYMFLYENDWARPMTGDNGEITYDINKPDKAFIITDTPQYEEYVKRQRDWYLKGYWSKSILSNKTTAGDAFKNGQSAVCTPNLSNADSYYRFVKSKGLDWDVEFFPIEGNTTVEAAPYTTNGTAVYRNSPNPERSVMFLELVHQDRDVYDSIFYGIKGKTYELTSDGKTKIPDGANPSDLGLMNIGMGLGDQKFNRISVDAWDYITKLKDEYAKTAKQAKYATMVLKTDSISAEIAAINNVIAQYKIPLDCGVVDPAQGLPQLRQKLKEAGIQKVLDEVNRQMAEYNKK